MIDAADLGIDGFTDLVRDRMGHADVLYPSRLHSFKKELVPDVVNVPETWYAKAFEELQAQGHLHHVDTGTGDFAARLSAHGRVYLRVMADDGA
jgi:hypothetical protein